MSYCKEEGRNRVMFLSEDILTGPSSLTLTRAPQEPSLIKEDGEINWNCPCLGGKATGPCGFEFRETFSCVHKSTAEPKGSDCFPLFAKMNECILKFPQLYNLGNNDDEDDDDEDDNDVGDGVDGNKLSGQDVLVDSDVDVKSSGVDSVSS